MRAMLITHDDLRRPSHYVGAFLRRLEELLEPTVIEFDRPSVDATGYDVVIVFARFRLRQHGPAWDWRGFDGLKVCMEHDAWLSYVPGSPVEGAYAPVFLRDGYDLVISTGKRTAELLRRDGVPAQWVPKGYDHASFHELGLDRSGACTYGTMWPTRRKLLHLTRELVDVSGPFEELNRRLNEHLVGVVCNVPWSVPFGRIGGRVQRIWPPLAREVPAVEPMIKTFETAAAGCALVVDEQPELADLGFVHGETCLTYSRLREVRELLASDPEDLARIGRAGAQLCASRHTWAHRADEVVDLLHRTVR